MEKKLRKVSDIFADRTHNQEESVLEVVKTVQYVLDLKPLVKNSQSAQTLKFRNSVLNGKDPLNYFRSSSSFWHGSR